MKKNSSENSEHVKLLRQQNASLLEENATKNEIIKILSVNFTIVIGICVIQIRSQKENIKQLRENL